MEVVAELQRGDEVVPACKALYPDVAVLAAALPGTDGFSAARTLYAVSPTCHSLIIGERYEPASARRAAAASAAGFIVRDAAPDFLIDAIRRAAAGRKVIDPDHAFAALSAAENPLTSRELDTLRLAAEGNTTAEIATCLCLSLGTVRNYLSRAIAKIGARNRVDAIRIAGKSGWL
jgi:two-component system response regulator DesR